MRDLAEELRGYVEAVRESVTIEDVVAEPPTIAAPSRRRRRRLVAVLATAALVAAVAVAIALVQSRGDHDAVVADPGTSSDAIVLLTALGPEGGGELVSLDPAAGSERRLAIPPNNYGEYPYPVLERGGTLVVPGSGEALVVPGDLNREPESLTRALFFVPSAVEDRIWAVSDWAPGNRPPFSVREVAVDGTVTVPEVEMPARFGRLIAGLDDGLLVQTGLDNFEFWDPRTGDVLDRFEAPSAHVVAAAGNLVALSACDAYPIGCDALYIRDLESGRESLVEKPAGTDSFAVAGAFSPDGGWLAVAVAQGDEISMSLVDVASGKTSIVAGSRWGPASQLYGHLPTVSWSESGNVVAFLKGDSSEVGLFELGAAAAVSVNTDVDDPLGLAVGSGVGATVPIGYGEMCVGQESALDCPDGGVDEELRRPLDYPVLDSGETCPVSRPALVRGTQLDGSTRVVFSPGLNPSVLPEMQFPPAPYGSMLPEGWRAWGTTNRLQEPGCYALQIDTTEGSDVVIFEAVP